MAYKVGKHIYMANVVVDQLVVLLDHLFLEAKKLDMAKDYWLGRSDSWYITEKTPFFWLRYYYQEWSRRIHFENTLKQLHQTSTYTTPIVMVTNKLQQVVHYFSPGSRVVPEPRMSEDDASDGSDGSGHGDDVVMDQDHGIAHPVKELEIRLARLERLEKLIATAIGRLSHFLGTMRGFQTIAEFDALMAQSLVLMADTMVLFNETMIGDMPTLQFDEAQWRDMADKLVELSAHVRGKDDEQLLGDAITETQQADMFKATVEVANMIGKFMPYLSGMIQREAPPNVLVRNWMRIVIGSGVVLVAGRYVANNMDEIREKMIEYSDAWGRFYTEHIEAPIANIWRVIRYDQKSMKVADPASLASSLQSLQRMVLDYAHDTYGSPRTGDDADMLRDMVARGDLTRVMKPYESSITAPIKNLLFGDLVRLVLIQVQKEKVDVDKGLLAIDKLLQANELNFQLLAAIPAVLVLAVGVWQIKELRSGKAGRRALIAHASILATLRRMHRQLTLGRNNALPTFVSPLVLAAAPPRYLSTFYPALGSDVDTNSLEVRKNQCIPFEQYGALLLAIDTLKQNVVHLTGKQDNDWMSEDLQDLESDLGNKEKLMTIQPIFADVAKMSRACNK
eukprot:gene15369-18230_t